MQIDRTGVRKFQTTARGTDQQEIQKLLHVGFIKSIQHPTWAAYIVPIKKKNGHLMMLDFRDLNKACPKMNFHCQR